MVVSATVPPPPSKTSSPAPPGTYKVPSLGHAPPVPPSNLVSPPRGALSSSPAAKIDPSNFRTTYEPSPARTSSDWHSLLGAVKAHETQLEKDKEKFRESISTERLAHGVFSQSAADRAAAEPAYSVFRHSVSPTGRGHSPVVPSERREATPERPEDLPPCTPRSVHPLPTPRTSSVTPQAVPTPRSIAVSEPRAAPSERGAMSEPRAAASEPRPAMSEPRYSPTNDVPASPLSLRDAAVQSSSVCPSLAPGSPPASPTSPPLPPIAIDQTGCLRQALRARIQSLKDGHGGDSSGLRAQIRSHMEEGGVIEEILSLNNQCIQVARQALERQLACEIERLNMTIQEQQSAHSKRVEELKRQSEQLQREQKEQLALLQQSHPRERQSTAPPSQQPTPAPSAKGTPCATPLGTPQPSPMTPVSVCAHQSRTRSPIRMDANGTPRTSAVFQSVSAPIPSETKKTVQASTASAPPTPVAAPSPPPSADVEPNPMPFGRSVHIVDPNLHLRLANFYQHHNPSKLPAVVQTLLQYKGKEVELFETLVRKYGPEPPMNDTPLPLGWERVKSLKGDMFYLNNITGRRQWERPLE